MLVTWGMRWSSFWRNGRNLQVAWVGTAAIVAFYVGVIRPQRDRIGINNARATGLAAVAEQPRPLALWRQERLGGIVGGVPGGIAPQAAKMATFLDTAPQSEASSEDAQADRKMVRTAAIEMLVQHPAETAEKIRMLAEREGGFLVNSEVRGEQDATGATLTIRVPAARFDQVRIEIRKLGLRIEDERIEAQDITRQYTDDAANLRNLKAEEQQYLLILKQARTVKDTLDVSEKLSDVRGQIEQHQAEFNALSKQIETVAITLTLHAQADTQILGLSWRPLYQIKLAFRDGLDGLGNYFSAMTAFAFLLPTIVLWSATIVLGGAIVWRILRWLGRRCFGWKSAPQPVASAS